jgi:apolipoprotein N-acyltransferase
MLHSTSPTAPKRELTAILDSFITRPEFLGLLSGIFLTASFPKIGLPWMAWGALVPLLLALQNKSPRQSFRIGLFAGLAHYLTLIYWLAGTMKTYGQLPWYVCWPVLFLFALYLALYIAGFSLMIRQFSSNPIRFTFMVPILWVAFEYIRATLLSGFPWEMLGYSQYPFLRMIQISDILGVYGVSFLVAFGNAGLFLSWQWAAGVSRKELSVKGPWVAGVISLFAVTLIAVLIYGEMRIAGISQLMPTVASANIAVIQGNISQSLKWDPAVCLATTEKYSSLSKSTAPDKPELIIWPETAAPFYFLNENRYTPSLLEAIKHIGTDFIIGSPAFERNGTEESYRNRAYLVTAKGTVTGHYDKSRLVPFGEFVPLKQWLPFIGKIVEAVGDFEAGPEGKTLRWGNYQLGMQICYEMIFPHLSRKLTLNGADCIVNITNDAWYGTSSAPYQLFSMAIFRAVENRRAVIRAANTGISGFVDPTGRIVGSTPLFEDAVMTRKTPLLGGLSIYTRYGDLFAMLCLAVTIMIIIGELVTIIKKSGRNA